MKITKPSSWPTTEEEAIAIQEELRHQVITEDQLTNVRCVAGVDVDYNNSENLCQGAVAVLSFPKLKVIDKAIAQRPISFPYVPGFLSFRELPVILDALEKLTIVPDLILCDGQGIIHPRRLGIASHLGVLTDLPTIGVGKSFLLGKHEAVPETRGSWQPLRDGKEVVGAVLRTRRKVKTVYVSIGHKISLQTAIDYVIQCSPKYRLPETTRKADKFASINN
ncbi:MAG: deoxyribonuclease V [Cyanobacteriota bacterium]|nr:deoxyribonuclease V [Cyanobacteriota bacterium]